MTRSQIDADSLAAELAGIINAEKLGVEIWRVGDIPSPASKRLIALGWPADFWWTKTSGGDEWTLPSVNFLLHLTSLCLPLYTHYVWPDGSVHEEGEGDIDTYMQEAGLSDDFQTIQASCSEEALFRERHYQALRVLAEEEVGCASEL